MVCSEFQCTSTLANSLHGMEDYAHHQSVRGDICALNSSDDVLAFFCGRRPLPFGGSHLRLSSGPAGIRTTTGTLSALARPTPYQLSHRGRLSNDVLAPFGSMWQQQEGFLRLANFVTGGDCATIQDTAQLAKLAYGSF